MLEIWRDCRSTVELLVKFSRTFYATLVEEASSIGLPWRWFFRAKMGGEIDFTSPVARFQLVLLLGFLP